MTTTGQRLRMLRESRGQSQDEIAKLIGVGRTTYLKYESGENKPTRKLKELSDLFQVSSDYIMGLSDAPTTDQSNKYGYDDPEVCKLAKELSDNPELKAYLCAGKGLSKEALLYVTEFVNNLNKTHGTH